MPIWESQKIAQIDKIRIAAKILHGLSTAVPSRSTLDINLKLFDILGRIGARGLWHLHLARSLESADRIEEAAVVHGLLQDTAELLIHVVDNNPILCSPIKDSQAIDINIGCLFLYKTGFKRMIQKWIQQTVHTTIFAYNTNGRYPCVFDDYRDLIDHPRGVEYRTDATVGSLLVPTLAVWAAITGDTGTLATLADFVSGPYQHSTLQLWYPGPDTEEHLYCGSANHGLAATGMRIERSCKDMLASIKSECASSTAFLGLSPHKYDLWPLIVSASRHHRVPVPPHFWPLDDP